MSHEIREYAITYAVKHYLLASNWEVIAYNPPGSQGTFTIPNPGKDGGYRGQTGSESPDVIAVKGGLVLIVECKVDFDLEDSEKLKRLSEDQEKMKILETLVQRVCSANDIATPTEFRYIFSLAYQGQAHSEAELGFISVTLSEGFDITDIPAATSYEQHFEAILAPASTWDAKILELLEN